MINEVLYSQRQAAEFLGLSERTLESMRLRKVGPSFVRLSRRAVRYRRSDLERFVDMRTVATAGDSDGDARSFRRDVA